MAKHINVLNTKDLIIQNNLCDKSQQFLLVQYYGWFQIRSPAFIVGICSGRTGCAIYACYWFYGKSWFLNSKTFTVISNTPGCLITMQCKINHDCFLHLEYHNIHFKTLFLLQSSNGPASEPHSLHYLDGLSVSKKKWKCYILFGINPYLIIPYISSPL